MKKSQVTLEAWDQELPNTLYNRLKDEHIKQLEALATTYPVSYRAIARGFRDCTTIYDVDFHIFDACRTMMDWDLNNLHNYFNKAR